MMMCCVKLLSVAARLFACVKLFKKLFSCFKIKDGEASAGHSSIRQARQAGVCEGGASAPRAAYDSQSDTADELFANVLAAELVAVDCEYE